MQKAKLIVTKASDEMDREFLKQPIDLVLDIEQMLAVRGKYQKDYVKLREEFRSVAQRIGNLTREIEVLHGRLREQVRKNAK